MAEEDTQRNEINRFSAMALGADDGLAPSTDAISGNNTPRNNRTSADNAFLNAFGGGNTTSSSGSFRFAAPRENSQNRSEAEKSNLNAAIALLSDSDPAVETTKSKYPPDVKGIGNSTKRNPQRIKPEDDISMFCEKVEMHRPLFFGPIIPPRVLKEARSMLQEAVDEFQTLNPGTKPRLNQLPPAVRNVVGAIRVFGFGLDIMDPTKDGSDTDCKGSDLVSTFQPVWGHDERAKRVKLFMKERPEPIQRPSIVSRSFTAPATMSKKDFRRPKAGSGPSAGGDEDLIPDKIMSENQLFSMWLRQDDESTNRSGDHSRSESQSSLHVVEDIEPSQSKDEESSIVREGTGMEPAAKDEMERFSMWATQIDGGTFVSNMGGSFRPSESISKRAIDSDDESLHEDEMKKQVGISDHLSKAIALLTADMDERGSSDLPMESTRVLSQQVPEDGSRLRPLSNYELTNGCVPLFAADDKALPDSADLGMHETREEQIRSNELKRSQETIERLVIPDVFGSVACPNPATRPDDTHSWNSRTAMLRQNGNKARAETLVSDSASIQTKRTTGSIESSDLGRARTSPVQVRRKESKPKRRQSRLRCGWFNNAKNSNQRQRIGAGKKLHIPPASLFGRGDTTLLTQLEPSPDDLRNNNLPLSHLHAATPMEQSLPYLSDRPHGFRYLQIDTQAVGFPSLKGEIEPLFCSLAIYNVENVSNLPGADPSPAPIPDLQRCAKVTEALYFDIVGDDVVAKRCSGALWPYSMSQASADRLTGTRCGIFPLPSNLNVSNLYAVLVVRKVFSNEVDLEPYLTPGLDVDVEKLRLKAEKASRNHGRLLMPLAFGVAPLLQVFGTDNPSIATSRAVQIPLFQFNGEEKQIIEHIMVMLYPRANHHLAGIGGPAHVTNGGNAMLVMRNFGYLGIHNAVDKKSSLARDRLVDFTGELQVKRDDVDDDSPDERSMKLLSDYVARAGKGLLGLVTEPTLDGGRERVESYDSLVTKANSYAQELAPIPLNVTHAVRLSGPTRRGRLSGQDVEPFFHTVFCNELIFQPRTLLNCGRDIVVIGVEIREIEWKDGVGHIAHVPQSGSSIHNHRRGPFLVSDLFTTCVTRRRPTEHHFIDEFKTKLPLDLTSKKKDGTTSCLSLLFTVYHVSSDSRSALHPASKSQASSFVAKGFTKSTHDENDFRSCLEQVSCGFLPMSKQGCLVENGTHDVQLFYNTETAPKKLCEQLGCPTSSLLLVKRKKGLESFQAGAINEGECAFIPHESVSVRDESTKARTERPNDDHQSLSVRILALTSIHSQEKALHDFLNDEPDLPDSLGPGLNTRFLSDVKINRHSLLKKALDASPNPDDTIEAHLVHSTSALSASLASSVPKSSPYILRALPILWRQLILGRGEPSLIWSNPGSLIPLRLHSFASILHIIEATCLHLSKNGVTEADGLRKWNMANLGRVISLLFDERSLFGTQSKEAIDRENWSLILDSRDHHTGVSTTKSKSQSQRSRHVRSRLYFSKRFMEGDSTLELRDNDILSSVAGALAGPLRGSDRRNTSLSRHGVDNVDLRIDSKVDFQNALRASLAEHAEEDIDRIQSTKTSGTSMTMMQALSSLSDNANRRFMTLPAPRTLMTISEAGDGDDEDNPDVDEEAQNGKGDTGALGAGESLHNDSALKKHAHGVRQMRIPARRNSKPVVGELKDEVSLEIASSSNTVSSALIGKQTDSVLLPPSDDDIEKLNIGFLDAIGDNLRASAQVASSDEENRVGLKNHRRLRSRSSIDWSLNGVEQLITTAYPESLQTHLSESGEPEDKMTMLSREEMSSIPVPNFIDRLVAIGKSPNKAARWFPYVYEVIICQWSYLLLGQRHSSGGSSMEKRDSVASVLQTDESLTRLASGCSSVAVAVAPVLLEVIKQSIGFRIHSIFHEILSKHDDWTTPPLVILDETLMASLEQVIRLLTDACLDQRNFDDWDLRQTSVDVNDAIILFLRDMFSFLAPSCVHRLILAYFSRFLDKENMQDKDSKVGLRCSWETTKLRLDAATALIRFVDIIKINSPIMLNWRAWWEITSLNMDEKFFNQNLVTHFKTLGVITSADGVFPSIRPHWLAELLVDVCLKGTEHVEAHIQQRAASLLHELIWACSQESIYNGIRTPVATMFFTLLEKLLLHGRYLSNFSPKNPLRKHLLPCVVYVLQWASPGLLRTFYRDLCHKLQGRGQSTRYRVVSKVGNVGFESGSIEIGVEGGEDEVVNESNHNVVDMFTLLNLALKTLEFEGSEEYSEPEETGQSQENLEIWRREFLLTPKTQVSAEDAGSTSVSVSGKSRYDETSSEFTSSVARRWQGHDSAMVIVNAVHQIILEMYGIMRRYPKGISLLNPIVNRSRNGQTTVKAGTGESSTHNETFRFTSEDILLFVRSSTSIYLHALSLQESDLVIIRTLSLSAEVIKIFGVATFLEAVGETLQHWMRVILFHCGARRATVRIESTDLLELILRTTWECFGSFFRIRVPLLAVQTEVMERIFATAASRYYREQRLTSKVIEPFNTVGAEASLAPLWRTLDRMETQPASQNVAFREALIRMAGKLKILYRAYIATRVLSLFRSDSEGTSIEEKDFETESKLRASRILVMRVVNASGGHSKQFLGFQGTRQDNAGVAHFEAVEDALLDAADVFSPTELPEHRFAWLRLLAELHASRKKFAEEATCHFQIHITLSQAAMLHGSLWTNTPFLPWTENLLDPGYVGGSENYQSDLELDDGESVYGRPTMGNISSRRMFYRVANSVGEGANSSCWDNNFTKTLFCGVALPAEYHSVKSWLSLKAMEETMVEEAEAAGELFLKAGIIDNSRLAWNLAAQYFAARFNYSKLQSTHGNLSKTIVSQVPTIDPNVPQEVTSTLGRFYRVWFHGGAPDELAGIEFVYRAEGSFCLIKFGAELNKTVKSIIQENTPIHLVLDGRVEERIEDGSSNFGNYGRIGPAPLAPVKVKVTPLRPLFSMRRLARGLPEWFYQYVEEASTNKTHLMRGEMSIRRSDLHHNGNTNKHDPHHREHSRSFSVGVFNSLDSAAGFRVGGPSPAHRTVLSHSNDGNLTGVDRFCFLQPRDRHKGSKDWWKTTTAAGITEKSVKVTQLQVGQPFPACVARQPVVQRLVYSISPLEGGVDAVCQWCSLLFGTAVATIGTSVLGTNADPGIGTDAAKVVVDSIHSSNIKEMGLLLLRNTFEAQDENADSVFLTSFDRHSEDEIQKLQVKFARLIVVFLELLHVLIGRNRNALLEIIHETKTRDSDRRTNASGSKANSRPSTDHIRAGSTSSVGIGVTTPSPMSGSDPHFRQPSAGSSAGHRRHTAKSSEDSNSKQNSQIHHRKVLSEDLNSVHSNLSSPAIIRPDSAIAVQSELQRSFTNLVKTLQPNLQAILRSESPRWLKHCTQENYFSTGGYRSVIVPIEAELCLASDSSAIQGLRSSGDINSQNLDSEAIADSIIGGSSQSVISKGSDRYGFVSF